MGMAIPKGTLQALEASGQIPPAARKPRGRGRYRPGVMNKTEALYNTLLELRLLAGEVSMILFESVKLRLADRTFYTPDFMVMLANGDIEFHETKGGFIHDDAIVKLKVAASMYPFRFQLCVYKNKATGWKFSEVGNG